MPRLTLASNLPELTAEPLSAATERAYWVAWAQVEGVGPVLQKRLHSAFGSLAAAWAAPPDRLLGVEGIGLLSADQIARSRSTLCPQQLLADCEAASKAFWTPADADYPASLFQIPDPPPVLYYRGALQLGAIAAPAVGIVGTRHPSDYGRRWTEKLTRQLVQQGWVIVSGMARGVDAIAHRCCLAQAGATVAVLGTGVDQIYPAENFKLYEQILQTGLLLSEYPDGTLPDRAHFPRRNRIVAGLSQAVLVTEAPERSGALITARIASDYGRPVYAVPGSLDNPRSQGCLDLIAQGVRPVVSEAQFVAALTELSAGSPATVSTLIAPEAAVPQPSVADLAPTLQTLLQVFAAEPMSLDRLVQQTGRDTGGLLSDLMQLELLGLVVQLPGAQYQRAQTEVP